MKSFLIKVVFSLFLLGFVLYFVDLRMFWKTIWTADARFLLIAILLFFPVQLLAAYRWYFVLAHLNKFVPFGSILCHSMLGQLSTFFLPGQISGDVVRFLAVGHGQMGKATLALSVIVDKLALLFALAIFALAGTLAPGPVSQFTTIYIAVVGTVTVVLPTWFCLCRYRTEQIPNWLVQIADCVPRLRNYVLVNLEECLTLPRISLQSSVVVLLLGLLLLFFYTIGTYFIARSMQIVINPIDWIAINAIVSLAQILPLTLGGLGVREGVFSLLLSLYAVPLTQAVAFSLTGFVLAVFLTAFCWVVLNVTLTREECRPQRK